MVIEATEVIMSVDIIEATEVFKTTFKQMLGCRAHVRKITLPHVWCACESVCGRLSLEVCVKCVRVGIFQDAMALFHLFFFINTLLFIMLDLFLLVLSLKLVCRRRLRYKANFPALRPTDQHFGRPLSYVHSMYLLPSSSFGGKAVVVHAIGLLRRDREKF